jgi:hypothetical protein
LPASFKPNCAKEVPTELVELTNSMLFAFVLSKAFLQKVIKRGLREAKGTCLLTCLLTIATVLRGW